MTTDQGMASAGHAEYAPPEAWDAIADGYDEFVAPGEAELSSAALRLVGLAPGERFLDVASGPGGLGLQAARLGANVLATDWAPRMIDKFDERVRSENLTHAVGRVMDAHALDLEDDWFDVTGSQFGVMLVPDQPLALREMVRVTKPGGRVVVVAYGAPARYEALQFFIAALQSVVPEFEGLPDPPPLEFQVSDPEVFRERLTSAGLSDVHVDTTQDERVMFRSGQGCWDWMRSGNPIVDMILGDVGVADQAKVRAALDDMIRERAHPDGVAVLTAPLNIGFGTKPQT